MAWSGDSLPLIAERQGWEAYHKNQPPSANPYAVDEPHLVDAWDTGWSAGFQATALCTWADRHRRVFHQRPAPEDVVRVFAGDLSADLTARVAGDLLLRGRGCWTQVRDRETSVIELVSTRSLPLTIGEVAALYYCPLWEIAELVDGATLLERGDIKRRLASQTIAVSL